MAVVVFGVVGRLLASSGFHSGQVGLERRSSIIGFIVVSDCRTRLTLTGAVALKVKMGCRLLGLGLSC